MTESIGLLPRLRAAGGRAGGVYAAGHTELRAARQGQVGLEGLEKADVQLWPLAARSRPRAPGEAPEGPQ